MVVVGAAAAADAVPLCSYRQRRLHHDDNDDVSEKNTARRYRGIVSTIDYSTRQHSLPFAKRRCVPFGN